MAVQVTIGIAQIIHDMRVQYGRFAAFDLKSGILTCDPIRRHKNAYRSRSYVIVPVLADADERGVRVVELAINSQIELIESKRAGIDGVELGKDRVIILYCKSSGLPVVLKVCEPEDSVSF